MIIKDIVQIGNSILSKKSTMVKDFTSTKTKQTITNLVDTMRGIDLIGIAAPQIGVNKNIFVIELRKTALRKSQDTSALMIFINPKIIWKSSKESVAYEGCGSVAYAKLFGPVKRPASVIIEAYNEHGEKIRLKAGGLLARAIQHEYDHLDGISFTEKITDIRKIMSADEYIKNIVQKK